MVIRRYVVKDMPEAVVSIRKELGKDAVILSTKKVRVKKWLGLLWQTRLEVTAAVGEDIPLHHRDVERRRHRGREDSTELKSPDVASQHSSSTVVSLPQTPDEIETPRDFNTALTSAFTAYETASNAANGPVVSIEKVLHEISSLKEMVVAQGDMDGKDKLFEQYERFLLKQGLSEDQVNRLLADLSNEHVSIVHAQTACLEHIQSGIIQQLGALDAFQPIASDSRVVVFVGPTGVGKTTSIAKIAALHVLAGQRKVGLLTTDTYRIAAIQQLQTYADILDVPFVVADGVDEVKKAMQRLDECDLILVDTAGRNFRELSTIRTTDKLLQELQPDESILVMSLTAKPEDADAIIEICEPLNIDKLLFTKLDETDTVGTVPRLMMKYDLAMCYVTTGQNVPDDIDMLNVSQILSRWNDRSDIS